VSYLEERDCEWSMMTAPAQEPLTLDEAKLQASVTQDDENLLVVGYLKAAREAAQSFLNRALFTQTWKLQIAGFDDVIWLPMAAPLQSVTSVQYYDENGTPQTLATSYYDVDTVSEPGRIVRKPNQTYPTVQSDRLRPVTVTYVCGWTDVDLIPEAIKQGIRVYLTAFEGGRAGQTFDIAQKAAEACWIQAGQVFWRAPECLYR